MKKILYLLLAVFLANSSVANVAQPGMWNAGYTGRFTHLFEEDSIHFGKIIMQKERVMINVYPGFAAVKGEYWMYNSTDKPITMTVGYPLNGGEYEDEKIGYVQYEKLSDLKVLVNDQVVSTQFTGDSSRVELNNAQWYYWKNTFAPNTVTKITVYFLTDNSNAGLREGYNSDDGNAFAYILESGRAWGGDINAGEVLIKLNGGLTLKNIKGIIPANVLKGDDTHLQFSFTNLEPAISNNVLLWYDKTEKKFEFKNIASNADKYFKELDGFPVNEFNQPHFKTIDKNNFEVANKAAWVFWGIIIAVALVGLAAVAGVVYLIIKLVKRF